MSKTLKLRVKSKSTVMREREDRCSSLYWHRTLKPAAITDILIDEGLFGDGASLVASRKWTQERVRLMRADAEPDAVRKLQRPAETKRYIEQLVYAQRKAHDQAEDRTLVKREVVTPRGDIKTVEEPRVSEGDRLKALKTFAALGEKLALVNSVNIKGAGVDVGLPGDKPEDDAAGDFAFNFSGKTLSSLIGDRIGQGEGVN